MVSFFLPRARHTSQTGNRSVRYPLILPEESFRRLPHHPRAGPCGTYPLGYDSLSAFIIIQKNHKNKTIASDPEGTG